MVCMLKKKCCYSINSDKTSEQKIEQLKITKAVPKKLISNSSLLNTPVSNYHNMNFGNSPKMRQSSSKCEVFSHNQSPANNGMKEITGKETDLNNNSKESDAQNYKQGDLTPKGTPITKNTTQVINSSKRLSNQFPKIELSITDSNDPNKEKKFVISSEGLVSNFFQNKSNVT